jgi:hypothetical protein
LFDSSQLQFALMRTRLQASMIATVTSTLVAENRPCRAAAAVPVSSSAA